MYFPRKKWGYSSHRYVSLPEGIVLCVSSNLSHPNQGPNFGFRTRDSSHRNTHGNSWMRRKYIEVAMGCNERAMPFRCSHGNLSKSGWNFVTGSSWDCFTNVSRRKFKRGSILKPGWETHSSMPKVQDLIQNETINLPMALYPLISLGLSSHLLSSLATRGISHI